VSMRVSPTEAESHSALSRVRILRRDVLRSLTPAKRSIKRILDLTGSLCLLLPGAPLMLVAAVVIRLTSAGPVLYAQTRVGAGGAEFSLYKLRTMISAAEECTGPVMAAADDPRVTWIGRFLRATHIDELPQLFNVLLGQMSLIGPRPERPHFVTIYRGRFPGYDLRLAVRPGITGLAQICCPYFASPALKPLRLGVHRQLFSAARRRNRLQDHASRSETQRLSHSRFMMFLTDPIH